MKTIVLTSGYYNPIHPGHIDCLEMSKALGDELRVIINSDHQAFLKRGVPSFQDQDYRMRVVSSLSVVDEVLLAVDDDGSVCQSLEKAIHLIKTRYGDDAKIIFTKGGDRFVGNIPEVQICKNHGIEIVDGLGDKTHSSRDYITLPSETTNFDFTSHDDALVYLIEQCGGMTIIDQQIRPWGCFVAIDNADTERFIQTFYPDDYQQSDSSLPITPKLLCVAPHRKLSWQYHHRRSEVWLLKKGSASYIASDTDDQQTVPITMNTQDVVTLNQGQRHRLVGGSERGMIAELREHTDPSHPSDEDDIVRIEDERGR